MPDPAVTPELVAKHGITPDEYQRIKDILKREPNFTELGIFSVMWSEHCSYKNSRPELRNFPTTGPTVLVKAGEDTKAIARRMRQLWGNMLSAPAFRARLLLSTHRGM